MEDGEANSMAATRSAKVPGVAVPELGPGEVVIGGREGVDIMLMVGIRGSCR